MTLDQRKDALTKRLNDLQGQKATLAAGLEQTTTAMERVIGQLQLLDELSKGNSLDTEEADA